MAEPPWIWRWANLQPLMDQAIAVAGLEAAERRVLTLANPGFKDSVRTSTNLNAGIQVLKPGEIARPHRHSANALRFVIEGTGAITKVDNKVCEMLPGDLILTPGWTWHEHEHKGTVRMAWLDVLDVPLFDYLKINFFEPGPTHNVSEPIADAAFATSGLLPQVNASEHSPIFRYPWPAANAAIENVPPATDGSRLLRYVNPVTGGPVMALIDCSLLRLAPHAATHRRRVSGNTICLVAEGEGESAIGDQTIAWKKHDIFTLPHWNWISHKASGAGATLFQVSDDQVLRRLGLWREEIAA